MWFPWKQSRLFPGVSSTRSAVTIILMLVGEGTPNSRPHSYTISYACCFMRAHTFLPHDHTPSAQVETHTRTRRHTRRHTHTLYQAQRAFNDCFLTPSCRGITVSLPIILPLCPEVAQEPELKHPFLSNALSPALQLD